MGITITSCGSRLELDCEMRNFTGEAHERVCSPPQPCNFKAFFYYYFLFFFNSFGAILCVFSPMRVLVPV